MTNILPVHTPLTPQQIDVLVENEYLGLPKDFDESRLPNLLMDNVYSNQFDDEFLEILYFMSQPENFYYTCKWLLGIRLVPFQLFILKELWTRKFPMLIGTRGLGKTFILALYAMLRNIFEQGSKIVLVGGAYRQSKLLFEYMEQFWRSSPVLQSMIGDGKRQGPKRDIDRCMFYVGESETCCIPIGDGSKIRGLRANYTIADEFSCLDKDSIVETKNGFVRISDFDGIEAPLLTGADNVYETPTKFIKTPLCDVYRIRLNNGVIIKCSERHKVFTYDGVWKTPLQLSSGDYIQRSDHKKCEFGSLSIDSRLSWLIGVLMSKDVKVNGTHIHITTIHISVAKKLKRYFGFSVDVVGSHPSKEFCGYYDIYKANLDSEKLTDILNEHGVTDVGTNLVKVPSSILKCNKESLYQFIVGVFEASGIVDLINKDGQENQLLVRCEFGSERLCRDVHFLLYKLGFDGHVSQYYPPSWSCLWSGREAYKLSQFLSLYRFHLTVTQSYVGPEPRGYYYDEDHKKWKVPYYLPGHRTQDRFSDEKDAANHVEYLRSLPKYSRVVSVEKLPCQDHLYDYYLPESHSFYADGFRQHNSIPQEVFEVVIRGFSAVSSSPEKRARDMARIKVLRSLGMYMEADDVDIGFGNQTIISGTAYYSFNHFYDYWKRYKEIIESRGDKKKLEEIFLGEVPENFDWTQFSIFRVPWNKIPSGFMDETQITQAKATIHRTLYFMEYSAAFARDSDGFFRRSLIESCVCKTPINLPISGPVQFSAALRGNPNGRYIFGIDPASENDNFAIVILEPHEDHRRIVYSWTIKRSDLKERIEKGGHTTDKTFYTYCARKIRDLMKAFPPSHIGIDAQGGGIAIMEALHDPSEIEPGEQALWPWIKQGDNDVFWWEKAGKPTDGEPGLHILHMVQFANADFTRDANHFLRKDLEVLQILFPMFDSVTLSEALSLDKVNKRTYDTLEDCVMEIEELKDEMATIEHTQTPTGRDKWDTPEVKLPGNKKGRLRKDRYSALLIANMIGHVMENELPGIQHEFIGGYAGQRPGVRSANSKMFVGPEYLVSQMNNGAYGRGVHR